MRRWSMLLVLCMGLLPALAGAFGREGGLTYTVPSFSQSAPVIPVAQAVATPDPSARPVLPDISFQDRSGGPVRLSQFRGSVVFLTFWTTWCSPCLNQLQSFNLLQESMRGKPFAIIPVSLDEGGIGPIRDFFDRQKFQALRPYVDPNGIGQTASQLRIQDIPTTIIIDKKGREVLRVVGSQNWGNPGVPQLIDTLLKEMR